MGNRGYRSLKILAVSSPGGSRCFTHAAPTTPPNIAVAANTCRQLLRTRTAAVAPQEVHEIQRREGQEEVLEHQQTREGRSSRQHPTLGGGVGGTYAWRQHVRVLPTVGEEGVEAMKLILEGDERDERARQRSLGLGVTICRPNRLLAQSRHYLPCNLICK